MKCVGCGKEFESKRVTARYCSAACRVRANRGISTKPGGIAEDKCSVISPVVLEMLGGLEKRVAALAALEADLVDRMVRLEDNVRDMQARKEPTRAIGSYHTKKDEDLFKRVVAEKAERLSIS